MLNILIQLGNDISKINDDKVKKTTFLEPIKE